MWQNTTGYFQDRRLAINVGIDKKCKEELLACDVFNAYVLRNQHWKKERIPTKKMWVKVFLNKDEEDE